MHEAFLAVAMIGCAAFAWDACRRYMQLAHGRMLSADRSQTFERAITQLETRVKRTDDRLEALMGNRATDVTISQDMAKELAEFERVAKAEVHGLHGRVDDVRHVIEQRRVAQDEWREGLTGWQKQCEQSIVLLQGEVDKRDKAIVSCVEEIRAIREQQAMALAGVANLPARGFAGKQRTP